MPTKQTTQQNQIKTIKNRKTSTTISANLQSMPKANKPIKPNHNNQKTAKHPKPSAQICNPRPQNKITINSPHQKKKIPIFKKNNYIYQIQSSPL